MLTCVICWQRDVLWLQMANPARLSLRDVQGYGYSAAAAVAAPDDEDGNDAEDGD